MSEVTFRSLFVLGPFLFCSIVPTVLFGVLLGEWGSNLVWGSYFGLGWCLAAFWTGNIVHDDLSATLGLLWAWIALVPLYFSAGALSQRLSDRRRKAAVAMLALSSLVSVPASTIMWLEGEGVHLPDYGMHLATSY